MIERIMGILERTRERIFGPQKVMFSNGLFVVASITGPEPTITLQDSSKVLLDLKSFAPKGIIIEFDPKGNWGAEIANRSHGFRLKMGQFKGVGAILDFLHECAHLQDTGSTDLALSSVSRYKQYCISENPGPEGFQLLRERHLAEVGAERSAWAFALINTRRLERQFGIDIIPQLGGVDGALQYVNSFVEQYEQSTRAELKDLGFQVHSRKETDRFWAEGLKNQIFQRSGILVKS